MIGSLRLHNIGPFADVRVRFPPARGGQFLALVGEGVTSALRGAAVALAGPNVYAGAPTRPIYPIVRDGCREGMAIINTGEEPFATYFSRDGAHWNPVQSREPTFCGFFVAYGADRVRDDNVGDNRLDDCDGFNGWRHIGSVFGDRACLLRPRHVLAELLRIASFVGESEWAALYGGAYDGTCGALAAILGAERVRMGEDHVEVDGVPLRRLGSGANGIAAWVADLCARWVVREVKAGRTVPADFYAAMDGVCIIDAIDAHLPPAEQVTLVERVRATFPRMTFIAGVEAPLTLCGLRGDEVVVLRDGKAMHNVADPRLQTASELYEAFYGIDRLHPEGLSNTLDLYTRLARNPRRDDADERALEELAAVLHEAGIKRSPPCRRRSD